MTDIRCSQDNSGTIEREEFLSLPQINSNPLATRYVRLPPSAAVLTPPTTLSRQSLTASRFRTG